MQSIKASTLMTIISIKKNSNKKILPQNGLKLKMQKLIPTINLLRKSLLIYLFRRTNFPCIKLPL